MREEEGGRREEVRRAASGRLGRARSLGFLAITPGFLLPPPSFLLPSLQSAETRAPAIGRAPATIRRPDGALDLRALERVIADQINAERGAQGLPPLRVSDELNEIARRYSRDMVERHFFAHQDPDGRRVPARVESAGILNWAEVGENIARNQGFADPAEIAVKDWMKSHDHRTNILDARYRETGIGVWVAPDNTVYFTQIFLTRKEQE